MWHGNDAAVSSFKCLNITTAAALFVQKALCLSVNLHLYPVLQSWTGGSNWENMAVSTESK